MLKNLFLLYLLLKQKRNIFRKRSINKSKVLGFQICGIGNGHLTQALTVYNILIKRYRIPIVIIYRKENQINYQQKFNQSLVIYKKTACTNNSVNDLKLIPIIKDIIELKQTNTFEQKYGINLWFNFWVTDWFNYRTKQIAISNQVNVNHWFNCILVQISKIMSLLDVISIDEKNRLSKYVVPPLITIQEMTFNKQTNVVLAYSVSGQDFASNLITIAKNHPGHVFYYFTHTILKVKVPKNIKLLKPNDVTFKKYFQQANCILSTAGDTLIMEAIYHKIPIAIMACSTKHIEQKYNVQKYVKRLKYALLMNANLDLNILLQRDVSALSNSLKKKLINRDKKIINLVEKNIF